LHSLPNEASVDDSILRVSDDKTVWEDRSNVIGCPLPTSLATVRINGNVSNHGRKVWPELSYYGAAGSDVLNDADEGIGGVVS
jgi:hypothetical protein